MASSISHDHKHLPKQFIITRKTVSRFGVPSSQSGEGNPHNLFHSNVPLQTREHALAGISGMLRSLAGAQGAFTSRGAKPKGLNLMLLGLIIKSTTTRRQRRRKLREKKRRSSSLCVSTCASALFVIRQSARCIARLAVCVCARAPLCANHAPSSVRHLSVICAFAHRSLLGV